MFLNYLKLLFKSAFLIIITGCFFTWSSPASAEPDLQKNIELLEETYQKNKERRKAIDEAYASGEIDRSEMIQKLTNLSSENRAIIESSRSEVGHTLCKYNDGTAKRVKGNSCPRKAPSRPKSVSEVQLNRPYLKSQQGIVGGSKCFYSDGSITKILGNYCPRRN